MVHARTGSCRRKTKRPIGAATNCLLPKGAIVCQAALVKSRVISTVRLLAIGLSTSSSLACVADGDDGRTRASFTVHVGGAFADDIVSNDGDRITLSVARLSLGALAFFEGDALFASSAAALRDSLLSFSSAHAHPGHYTPGEALADMGEVGVIDLLGGGVDAVADGLTGPYGTVTVPLTAADEASATLTLRGTFAREQNESTFVAVLPFATVVEGVPADFSIEDGDRIELAISLAELVRRVDFRALPTVDPIDLVAEDQAKNALERALASQTTYITTHQE